MKIHSEDFLKHLEQSCLFISPLGPRILLNLEDSYLFIISFLSAVMTGKSILVLPNRLPGTLRKYLHAYDSLIEDFQVQTILDLNPSLKNPNWGFIIQELSPWTVEKVLKKSLESKCAVSFCTSGSSGEPKIITRSWADYLREIGQLEKAFGKSVKDSIFISTVSHQHIYGFIFKILWPLLKSHPWCSGSFDFQESIQQFCHRSVSTILVTTPAFLKRSFLENEQIQNCQSLFSSGGWLEFKVAQRISRCFRSFPIEVYGSTESGGIAFRSQDQEHKAWKTFDDVEIKILEDGLEVKTPFLGPQKLKLNDLIEVTPEGFQLRGRSDDVVKVEDKRISLEEINVLLRNSNLISDVVSIKFERRGRQQIGCLIVPNEAGQQLQISMGTRELIQQLRSHLRDSLDPILIPRTFKFIKSIPFNEQSKLPRHQILEYFSADR